MSPEEAVIQITESFIVNMTVEQRDPWEFFDWQHNTWGFQQTLVLQTRLREILTQTQPSPMEIEHAVRVTKAVFGTTKVPFNESAHGLGGAAADVFRSALELS